MLPIILGVPALVLTMAIVIGVPFVHYRRLDRQFEATHGQPTENRIRAWYEV